MNAIIEKKVGNNLKKLREKAGITQDCDAHLNKQSGFNTYSGSWICEECGYDNDVSEDNILSKAGENFVRDAYVVCPHCGAHMKTDDCEYYECPDCDCSGIFEVNEDRLIEN